jgi:hypothetical protein
VCMYMCNKIVTILRMLSPSSDSYANLV